MRLLLAIFIFVLAPLQAAETDIGHFTAQAKKLESILLKAEEGDYALSPLAAEICEEFSQLTLIKGQSTEYYVDLFWIRDVAESIRVESSPKKRRLIFSNLVDTMNGMILDMNASMKRGGATRQEMNDALDRAISRTSVVSFSNGVPVSSSIEWTGNGAYVVEGTGEGISIISAEPMGQLSGESFSSSGGSSYNGSGSEAYSSGSGSYSSGSGSYSSGSGTSISANSGSSSHASIQSNSSGGSSGGVNSGVSPQTTGISHVQNHPSSQPVKKPASVARPPAPAKPIPQKKPPPPPKLPKKPTGLADYVFWIIMAVCVISFLVMLYFLIRKTRKKIIQDQHEFEKLEKSLPPERMRNESIYEKALKAAAEGNFAEGIRLLTIGALLMLEQQRVMHFQETLTNGEYLKELLRERQLYSMFKEPMSMFDLLIYGFRNPGQQDFEKFKKFYLELEKVQK